MTTMVPVFPGDITVGEAINQYFEKTRTGAYEPHNYIYVVDSSGKLIGYVELRTLLLKPRNTKLAEIAHPVKAVVNANADREEAARIAVKYDLIEVPVVDDQGRFLGIVTLDDLLDVITSEYQEDLLKYAGIAEAIKGSYVTEKPWRLAIRRIPAIIALYLMDTITGGIVASFTNIIERVAVLAAFMPILADNSGNIGSQSSAIIIRGLVTGELRISRRDTLLILRKEFATTMLMLSILAPVGFAIGLLIPFITTLNLGYSLKIATTVTLALIASCYVADLVGAFLPLLLAKLRIDPATASAPLIT
ncbi:MAG: magnesium transporter, partial [Ignisphaera sp.]|nr:magnesium transporter [Ignisphaera sp.]